MGHGRVPDMKHAPDENLRLTVIKPQQKNTKGKSQDLQGILRSIMEQHPEDDKEALDKKFKYFKSTGENYPTEMNRIFFELRLLGRSGEQKVRKRILFFLNSCCHVNKFSFLLRLSYVLSNWSTKAH